MTAVKPAHYDHRFQALGQDTTGKDIILLMIL